MTIQLTMSDEQGPGVIAIVDERDHQELDLHWSREHDAEHQPEEWVLLIDRYAALAVNAIDDLARRHRYAQIGALALAAIEAIDRRDNA